MAFNFIVDESTRTALKLQARSSNRSMQQIVQAQIEQWVQSPDSSKAVEPEQFSARLTVNLPDSVKDDFETECIRADVSMSEIARGLTREWIQEQNGYDEIQEYPEGEL